MNLTKTLSSIVASSFLAMSLSGCFGFMIRGGDYKAQVPRSAKAEEHYSYYKDKIDFTQEIVEEEKRYTLKRMTFKSCMQTTENNDTAKIDYYDVRSEGKTPLIIISPILGGSNSESEIFAEYFANRGFSCAIFYRPEDRFPDAEKVAENNRNGNNESYVQGLEKILQQSIIDTRRAIDLFETFPDIDAEKIGSFGISMGGIKNATLAGIEPRLKVNVFVMAGADFEYILRNSREGKVVEEVENASKVFGREKFFEDLKKNLISDPKNFAQHIDDSNTLMYVSLFDTVVPLESQLKLRKLIGNPTTAYFLSGHYTAILYILPPWYYVQRTSFSFFKERFNKI